MSPLQNSGDVNKRFNVEGFGSICPLEFVCLGFLKEIDMTSYNIIYGQFNYMGKIHELIHHGARMSCVPREIIIKMCHDDAMFKFLINNGLDIENGSVCIDIIKHIIFRFESTYTGSYVLDKIFKFLGSKILGMKDFIKQNLLTIVDALLFGDEIKICRMEEAENDVKTVSELIRVRKINRLYRARYNIKERYRSIVYKNMLKLLMMEFVMDKNVQKSQISKQSRRMFPFPVEGGHHVLFDIVVDYSDPYKGYTVYEPYSDPYSDSYLGSSSDVNEHARREFFKIKEHNNIKEFEYNNQ
jgi:hypothetical protein